jgi:hypothetical protein
VETTVADDPDNAIRDNAAGPRQVSADGVSVEQHPLADQIAADRYLAGKKAMSSPTFGLRVAKIVPPGAVSR